MANTYTQLHIHIVFAVKFREALIKPDWENQLHQYITGIIKNNGHKLLAINSAVDHIHILIGLHPKQSLSELIRQVKCDSSEFINRNKLNRRKFQWQEGFGAFSTSHSQIDKVVRYIINQKEHHKKRTFSDEYCEFLKRLQVEYNEKYVFHAPV
jgi:REP element-mobilizing transposase RayT